MLGERKRLVALSVVALALACSTDRGSGGGTEEGIGGDGDGDGAGDGDGDGDATIHDVSGNDDAPGGDGDGTQAEQCDIDVVFSLDVSTSMSGFLAILEQEIGEVHDATLALEPSTPPQYGLVVFVDDVLMTNGGQPYTDIAEVQQQFATWYEFTSSNVQVNPDDGQNLANTTFLENSLDSLHAGADDFQWRESADPDHVVVRLVVHVTDDGFWDGPTTGNGEPINHSYAETVSALQTNEARVFAFTADQSPVSGDVSAGFSAPYMGMDSIPVATDGARFDISEIVNGNVSLADALNGVVLDKFCEPFPPIG